MQMKTLAASLGLVALSSCGLNNPSESQARGIFEARLNAELGSTPHVIDSFSKKNGQEADVLGVHVYRLFYSASVSFPEGNHPECMKKGNEFTGFDCMFQVGQGKSEAMERGASKAYSGEIDFQKTENGWVPA